MPDWLDPNLPLLPKLLKKAGYVTGHFGKWHLTNRHIPDAPLPTEYGYDEYGAFNVPGLQIKTAETCPRAVDFIRRHKEKPFFINVWLHEPHTPHHTLPKYRWRFPKLDEPDNIYAAILSHADDRVGEILDALDRLGLTDNTLVIFSSDNGPAGSSDELSLFYDSATGAGYGRGASKGITGGRKGF